MKAHDFFAVPPKAERAFLSAYGSEALDGQFGVRIEIEPLSFVDAYMETQLEPEICLSYLKLRTIDPAQLENSRFSPDANYEGSCYFLGEHNWVDLKEIRFLDAAGNSILTEYDVVIHLPKDPPNKYAITLRTMTEITVSPQPEGPRTFDGLGQFVQPEKDLWRGIATYDGHVVEIEFSTNVATFEEMATYARSVIVGEAFPRSKMNAAIANELEWLEDKFRSYGVSTNVAASDFVPRGFYFHKRRHHHRLDTIIWFNHPVVGGHWSLTLYGLDDGDLHWGPDS